MAEGLLAWLPQALRRGSGCRELAAGEAVFRQGDKALAVFEVEQGRLRLVRHTGASHPVILHTARKGELFAEAALFAQSYHCDAIAVVASRVRVHSKQALLAAFRIDPAAAERFMAVLARQIHVLRARLEERNIRSARERILHHLALGAGPDGETFKLDGTLKDLAAEIGLAHEVLYRTLAALQAEARIVRTGSTIALRRRRSGRRPA